MNGGSEIDRVYSYHAESKHRPERYAPGPGHLDWRTQPYPFRVFEGAAVVTLPLSADENDTAFADVRQGNRPRPAPVDLKHLGQLLELSFGISAWKSYGGSRWALRCNPSSGNLHPTECYLVTDARAGLAGGVYHYRNQDHSLELRAEDLDGSAAADPAEGVMVALTSIHWREAWKYGLRAYRYCQLDIGHAMAALSYAAAALGWRVERIALADLQLERLLGLDRAEDFHPAEQESPDLAFWVGPGAQEAERIETLVGAIRRFDGRANRLSAGHVAWSGIDLVHAHCRRDVAPSGLGEPPSILPALERGACTAAAARLIHQRRSAVDFDGLTQMPAADWFALLDALLPRPPAPPFDSWPTRARVNLLLFVHRVRGLPPGLYVLARDPDSLADLRSSVHREWLWQRVPDAPGHLELYCLVEGDAQQAAQMLGCHQSIASDSCFAVAMLARFDAALSEGPWAYRELFWECGLVGQILYLEAEAAGLRGTGIGCFFDDAVHSLLGLRGAAWQSLYHFTVGGPLGDDRLQTEPPYAQRRSSED